MQRMSVLVTLAVCVVAGCSLQTPAGSDSHSTATGNAAGGGQSSVPTSATATKNENVLPTAADGDWPWWRGPNRNGIADEGPSPPVTWSDTKNVIWKIEVPGRGHSSPTIVADRIYLATTDERQQIQAVLAFNRSNGSPLWKTDVNRGGFPRQIHRKNTHATCTVACDGERLFVAFFNNRGIQATALDLHGKRIWQKVIGPFQPRIYEYGYAPSPAIYHGLALGRIFLLPKRYRHWRLHLGQPYQQPHEVPLLPSLERPGQLLQQGLSRDGFQPR